MYVQFFTMLHFWQICIRERVFLLQYFKHCVMAKWAPVNIVHCLVIFLKF